MTPRLPTQILHREGFTFHTVVDTARETVETPETKIKPRSKTSKIAFTSLR